MTGFRWFSKIFVFLYLETEVASASGGLKGDFQELPVQKTGWTKGLSQDFNNACPKQQFV